MVQDLEALARTGHEALLAGAWREARSAFEKVLDSADLPEVRYGLAESMWWLGDMQGAMDNYERAYVGFRRQSDHAHAAGVALLIGFHSRIHLANQSAADGWIARAARLIDDHEIAPLRGELLLMRAACCTNLEDAEELASRALETGREAGDIDLELCAMSLLGAAIVQQGRVEEGMALLNESMAGSLGGEPSKLETVVFTSCNMMVSCSRCAAFERAAEWIRAAKRFSERYGCPFLFAECRLVYGYVLFQTGRWDEAEEELLAAIELSRGSVPAFFADACGSLGELRLAQGRVEAAERLLEEIQGADAAAPLAASLHMLRGDHDLAASIAIRQLEDRGDLRLDKVRLIEILAEAEIAAGDVNGARQRGERLIASGTERGCRVAVARGERLVGRALAASEPADAGEHLERGLQMFKELEMPFEAGLTCLALAELLATSQPEKAVAEAEAALATLERLGAQRHADEAAALLRNLGVRATRTVVRTDGAITRREEEVMALLGEGLSNPEIADRLFISRKTVEHHVSSVLAKLELRNRAEAAAEAVRMGLTSADTE